MVKDLFQVLLMLLPPPAGVRWERMDLHLEESKVLMVRMEGREESVG